MLTWGVITVLMGFTKSMQVFCGLRLALGVAEAGFYPGVIYYLTLWFPQSYRARVLGVFTPGSALANMLGSLVGGWLLSLNGVWGFAGWQWVFIATGLPAVLVGVMVFRLLPASYREARFLSEHEKALVAAAHEREKPEHAEHAEPWKALLDPRVMLFALTYLLMSTSLYGVTCWLPTLVKSFGMSSGTNGMLSMLPWALSVVVLLYLPGKLRRAGGAGFPAESFAALHATALHRARARRRLHSAALSVLLVDAAALLHRRARGGQRHGDQLHRQSGRLLRPEPDAARGQGHGHCIRADDRAHRLPCRARHRRPRGVGAFGARLCRWGRRLGGRLKQRCGVPGAIACPARRTGHAP